MRTTAAMALVLSFGLGAQASGVSMNIFYRGGGGDPNRDGYTVDTGLDGLGGQRGETVVPLAIVNLKFEIRITDAQYFESYVARSTLTDAEAWGKGLPNGYNTPPVTNPEGPWTGMHWGYRDAFDGGVVEGTPGGNDRARGNGWEYVQDAHVSGISDIEATMDWQHYGYDRGTPGNGVNHRANIFSFEIVSKHHDTSRNVHIDVLPTSTADVLVDNNGHLEIVTVQVNGVSVDVTLPAPGTGVVFAGGLGLVARRRRR